MTHSHEAQYYIASSLDAFFATEGDLLAWLCPLGDFSTDRKSEMNVSGWEGGKMKFGFNPAWADERVLLPWNGISLQIR